MVPANKSDSDLSNRYGPWALVTGAAVGLGAEFAKQLAAQNINLILVDIDKDNLGICEAQLRQQYNVEICCIEVDLASDNFLELIIAQLKGREIGLLINNAGVPHLGEFLPQSPDFLIKQLNVNMRAVLLLTHHFGGAMVGRGKGGIIILSSMAAMNGGAFNAHYSATKAYDLVLAESLWAEWKSKGVDVLGFMPWKTATPGYFNEPTGDSKDVLTVEETVTEALMLLGKKPSGSVGINAKIALLLARLISRSRMIKIASSHLRKMVTK
jgi:short-subunit dehydrogenase